MDKFPHIPAMAPWTAALIDVLNTEDGETIPVEQLEENAHGQVAPGGNRYGSLNTAIKHVERYYGKVWRWERNATFCGVRRLTDDEKALDAHGRTRRIHRAAVRNTRILGAIDLATLTVERRAEVIGLTTIQAIVSLSTRANAKQFENVKPENIDLRKMLEAVKK